MVKFCAPQMSCCVCVGECVALCTTNYVSLLDFTECADKSNCEYPLYKGECLKCNLFGQKEVNYLEYKVKD